MALPTDDLEWVLYLSQLHDGELPELDFYDAHYEGTQPLNYMHPELLAELGERIRQVVLFWPELVVGAIEERLDVENFRLPNKDAAEDDLWRVWQANDMDEQSQLGHIDALVMRRYYVAVGTDETDSDTPLVTAESPKEMYVDIDPRTRRGRAGLRRVLSYGDIVRDREEFATLYRLDRTVWYERAGGQWREIDRDQHDLGRLPVVPVVNRGRLSSRKNRFNQVQMRRLGTSELQSIIPLSDAANKIATDMMVTADSHAIPVWGFWGLSPKDVTDEHGNPLTAMQAMMRKFLTLPFPDGADGQPGRQFEFRAADLRNFHETIELLAKMVSAMAGLPPNYLGLAADDAASADAIRSREARLVKRAERKQRAWGGSYEEVGRLIRRFQSGEWDPELRRLETVWRDPSTPTVAQKADAAVKKYQTTPRPIVPLRQTREDLGYTDAQIRRMEADDEREARLDPVAALARDVANTGGVPADPGAVGSGERDGGAAA